MSLNIKNKRVHDLAKQAAQRTGRSQTSVIEIALEQYLRGLDLPDRRTDQRARIDVILADFDMRLAGAGRADMTTDGLYDENGLPA